MVRILQDRGMYASRAGAVALTSAAVNDVTAWILLAVVVALTQGNSAAEVLIVAGLSGLFAIAVLTLVPRWSRWLADRRPKLLGSGVVVVVLLCGAATEWIGIHAIFGAFLLGIACPGDHPAFAAARERLEGTVRTLLLPLFFALSGVRTDLRPLGSHRDLWLWCGFVCLAAVAGKLGGATLAARGVGVDWATSLRIGTLMNCRGLTELIILNVGLELGVIDPRLFTVMVVMALVSTAMTGPLLSLLDSLAPESQSRTEASRPGVLPLIRSARPDSSVAKS
jgi:Kef-type K+ transport system membrane component KefB